MFIISNPTLVFESHIVLACLRSQFTGIWGLLHKFLEYRKWSHVFFESLNITSGVNIYSKHLSVNDESLLLRHFKTHITFHTQSLWSSLMTVFIKSFSFLLAAQRSEWEAKNPSNIKPIAIAMEAQTEPVRTYPSEKRRKSSRACQIQRPRCALWQFLSLL